MERKGRGRERERKWEREKMGKNMLNRDMEKHKKREKWKTLGKVIKI